MITKGEFMVAVTVLIDSREQEKSHITKALDGFGVPHETVKLDIGDYSFRTATRDFRQACVIERKADVDEVYSNLMERFARGQLNRLEKEIIAGSRTLNQFVMLIEGVGSMEMLRNYVVPDWKMQAAPQRVIADVGKCCHAVLKAWQAANRYNFRVEFAPEKEQTAARILEEFYYYYHNYLALIVPRKQ